MAAEPGDRVRRGALRTAAVLALLALLAVVATSMPALGRSGPGRSCEAHRRASVHVTPRVVVYRVRRGGDAYESPTSYYYACLRPGGKRLLIGANAPDDGEYGSDATTEHFKTAGPYVGALLTSGVASLSMCSKYQQDPCPAAHYWVRVLDVRSGRVGDFPTVNTARALALSPAGVMAWLVEEFTAAGGTQFVLHAVALSPGDATHLTGVPQVLDRGTIDPGSLHFKGRTLHWAHTRAQTL